MRIFPFNSFLLTLACVLVMLLAGGSNTLSGAGISLVWSENPAAVVALTSRDGSTGLCVDLEAMGRALDAPVTISSHRERLRLDFPSASLIFTAGNPYVLVEGRLRQMPLPLEPAGVGFFAPVEAVMALLTEFYPGRLAFDPISQKITGSKPTGDLLGIRFEAASGGACVVLTAARPSRPCTERQGKGVKVVFPKGTIDAERLATVEPRGCIASAALNQTGKGFEIVFQPDSATYFDRMEVSDDPPLCMLYFVGGELEAEESVPTAQDVSDKLDEDRKRWDMDVVVIDAGHGGKDPGAVGKGKLREKDVTLDVALLLRKALEKRGIKTVMTRDTDRFLELHERTRLANNAQGKLFVSLHCNAAPNRKAVGLETYFLSPTKTDRARRVALLENSVIDYEEIKTEYQDLTEENFILLAMAQANFVRESQDLAVMVQERVGKGAELKDRGVDQAGFYVLVGASMPAVLVEMGFISNPAEEKRLRDKAFRQKLADNLAASVEEFLKRAGE